MKHLFQIIFVIFLITNIFSQSECGTLNQNSPVYVDNEKAGFISHTFKVYYHKIRKSNGKKPSTNSGTVIDAHNFLNNSLLSSNFDVKIKQFMCAKGFSLLSGL